MSLAINCNAKNSYQADFQVPDTKRNLAAPSAAGQLAGIRIRFSTTKNGSAIAGDVDALVPTEAAGLVGRLYFELSQVLHQNRLLTLGVGASYYVIWYLPGVFDIKSVRFTVADGDYQ